MLQDDPKNIQQKQAYEAEKQQAEQKRVAVQRQAWLRQSLARRRMQAARQQQHLMLRSRARAFDAKVDAIRSVHNASLVCVLVYRFLDQQLRVKADVLWQWQGFGK